jgi:hypothetical protein
VGGADGVAGTVAGLTGAEMGTVGFVIGAVGGAAGVAGAVAGLTGVEMGTLGFGTGFVGIDLVVTGFAIMG